METIIYFFLIYILYISVGSFIIGASSFIDSFNLKYGAILPKRLFNLPNWCFFIKEKKQQYFLWNYFYLILIVLFTSAFIVLGIIIFETWWYIFPIVLTFVVLVFIMSWKIIKYNKKINNLGCCELTRGFKNFLELKQSLGNDVKFTSWKIKTANTNKLSFNYQKAINRQNKLFIRKINKLKNHQDQQKIVCVFNLYLKRWTYFINFINNSNLGIFLDEAQINQELFAKLVIENFFAWCKIILFS